MRSLPARQAPTRQSSQGSSSTRRSFVPGEDLQLALHAHRRVPAVVHGNRVAAVEELLGERGRDQTGSADDEGAHRARG